MPHFLPDERMVIGNEGVYADSWEHLLDELRRLELLIHLQVLKQQNWQPADQLQPLKGLVISKEEIDRMLAGVTGPLTDLSISSPNDAKMQSLMEALSRLEYQIRERRAASMKEGVCLSLPRLSQLFQLTPFEENCILTCLAPELDRKYEKLYAFLQDDVMRKKPSVDLVLNLHCHTVQEKLEARLAFEPQAPVQKCRLLQTSSSSPDGPAPLLSCFLKLDDRIVNFLLGFGQIDARLEPVARLVTPRADLNHVVFAEKIQNRVSGFVQSHFSKIGSLGESVVLHLYGPYGSGKQVLAEAVSHDLGLPLIVADIGKMLDSPFPFEESMWLIGRELVLQPVVLCLVGFDYLLTDEDKYRCQLKLLFEVIRTFSCLTFLLGSRSWNPQGLINKNIFIEIEFPVPGDVVRKQIWESLKSRYQFVSDVDLGALAVKFRFTPGQIRDALVTAQSQAHWRLPDDGRINMTDLYTACRSQSNKKLGALAPKIKTRYNWRDIILPADQTNQLGEIVNQVKYRHLVYGEWGFDRKLSHGKGLNVLFYGPPGTGKTMAAEVIANEVSQDLYKIDLSQVVSKYIGETEKNLERIFREAQASNAILFFDEADALFGKRSEVKDAHDRYANVEIAYLLQKMDEYDGIVILATNLRQHMDEAFVRRIHIIVEFPFPDEEYRRRIWEAVFPREAPLGDDVDFGYLAREIRMAGGNIKNIALAAAFYAAGDGGIIRMPHLVQAVRREHQKLGRTWNESKGSSQGTRAY